MDPNQIQDSRISQGTTSVVAKGETMLGKELIEKWSSKMEQARRKPIDDEEETSSCPQQTRLSVRSPM